MRNKAEKLRRDKLNSYITKLGGLLPSVNTTPKRMDKTSILRLASNFLRCHRCEYRVRRRETFNHFQEIGCIPANMIIRDKKQVAKLIFSEHELSEDDLKFWIK